MGVLLPNIILPTQLRQAGPAADPSILLVGQATIGSTEFIVTAIRINQYQTAPDHKEGIRRHIYERSIASAVDIADFLMDTADFTLLPLEHGSYLLWMVPMEVE